MNPFKIVTFGKKILRAGKKVATGASRRIVTAIDGMTTSQKIATVAGTAAAYGAASAAKNYFESQSFDVNVNIDPSDAIVRANENQSRLRDLRSKNASDLTEEEMVEMSSLQSAQEIMDVLTPLARLLTLTEDETLTALSQTDAAKLRTAICRSEQYVRNHISHLQSSNISQVANLCLRLGYVMGIPLAPDSRAMIAVNAMVAGMLLSTTSLMLTEEGFKILSYLLISNAQIKIDDEGAIDQIVDVGDLISIMRQSPLMFGNISIAARN